MRTHIDWLTFTFTPEYADDTIEGYANALTSGLCTMFGEELVHKVFSGASETKKHSRAPYTDAWIFPACGLSIFASPSLTHACVEISGQGCERLIADGALNDVLAKCADRVTRIDVATDIETNVLPSEFVSQVTHERMRAHGSQISETGQTEYVGSQKSDRYARVYRYNPPHPRAKLLRIEHVFRRDYAKSVAKACVENGIVSVAASAGKAFGWAHGTWILSEAEFCDIAVTAPEKGGGKTVTWLVRSVAPAFRRLVADGTIRDPQAFFEEYLLPR